MVAYQWEAIRFKIVNKEKILPDINDKNYGIFIKTILCFIHD